MEIRPCDAQMFINKSTSDNKNETLRQNDFNQNLSEYFKKNTEQDTQKPIETGKTGQDSINSNKDGKGHFNEGDSKKNKFKKNAKKEEKKQGETHIFDVSI